jgi:hypothetical protein
MSPLEWLLLLGSVKYLTSALTVLVAVCIYQSRRGLRTRLRGPPSPSFLFGVTKKLFPSSDIGVIYHDWERTYGPVYEIPASLGSSHVVLSDPKAIAHFFSKDTTTYYQPDLARAVAGPLVSSRVHPAIFFEHSSLISLQFGDFLSAVEGETHKRSVNFFFCSVVCVFSVIQSCRQRRALSGAFSISAMRDVTPVFLDCAYQVRRLPL